MPLESGAYPVRGSHPITRSKRKFSYSWWLKRELARKSIAAGTPSRPAPELSFIRTAVFSHQRENQPKSSERHSPPRLRGGDKSVEFNLVNGPENGATFERHASSRTLSSNSSRAIIYPDPYRLGRFVAVPGDRYPPLITVSASVY
jgi:hypothetical protein